MGMAELRHVLAAPAERAALRRLESVGVDAAALERGDVLLREVLAHHGHDRDRREVTRRAPEKY
jgi:hypothetical protein